MAALLGIGLMVAALLLPSADAPVVVPADTLQPAGETAAAPDDDGADLNAGFSVSAAGSVRNSAKRGTRKTAATPASSSASVAGDDLRRADVAQPTTAAEEVTPRAPASSDSKPQTGKRRPRPKTTKKRTAPAPAPAPSPTPAAPAPVAQPAPAPAAPAPAPKPKRKARGGPSAEFGGL